MEVMVEIQAIYTIMAVEVVEDTVVKVQFLVAEADMEEMLTAENPLYMQLVAVEDIIENQIHQKIN